MKFNFNSNPGKREENQDSYFRTVAVIPQAQLQYSTSRLPLPDTRPRSLSENALLPKIFVIFKKQCSQVREDSDIKYMAVLVLLKCLGFGQVSVDSEMPILGQPPSRKY